MTQEVIEVRRENLRTLVRDKYEGNRAALARAASIQQNQINLILTDNPKHRRNIGESLARRIEAALSLPSLWMDQEHLEAGREVITLKPMSIGPELAHILRSGDSVLEMRLVKSALANKVTTVSSLENIALATLNTADMADIGQPGCHVLVDTGAKAISQDGVYILGRGDTRLLRRVSRQLTGELLIGCTNPLVETLRMPELGDIEVHGRIVATMAVVSA